MRESRSFKEYISNNLENKIFTELDAYIKDVDPSILDLKLNLVSIPGDMELDDELDLKFIDVYDLPGSRISFDVVYDAPIIVHDQDRYHNDKTDYCWQWFIISCSGDLDLKLSDFNIENIEIYNGRKKRDNPLTNALVPVLYHDKGDYEKIATKFLRQTYKKALLEPCWVDPMEIAANIGLTVIHHRISEDMSIFGQIYFREDDVKLYGNDDPIHVMPGTIIVDPDVAFERNIGAYNNTIIHECVHWYLHKKAFALEELFNKNASKIICLVEGGLEGRSSKDMLQMERQANSIAPRIQMPESSFRNMRSKFLKEVREETGKFDLIDVIEPLIDKLATYFVVSRASAKIRLVELGYQEAIGTFNYIDDHYVQTFSFKKDSIKLNQTFCIGALDATRLFVTQPEFKEKVLSGAYRYVDSHFILADPLYLAKDAEGDLHLTEYARTHIDQCALIFDVSILNCSDDTYRTICYLNREKESNVAVELRLSGGLKNAPPERQNQAIKDDALRNAALYQQFTTDFTHCIQLVMKDKKINIQDIADDTKLSRDTVSNILHRKTQPEKMSLALICISLRITYNMSKHIMENGNCRLAFINEDEIMIDTALATCAGQTGREFKSFLRPFIKDEKNKKFL